MTGKGVDYPGDWRNMSDLLSLLVILAFSLATCGLLWLCDWLMEA
jgi:hypothetical protein